MQNFIISIGEMLIDFIPEVQSGQAQEDIPCYRPYPGGSQANVAVAIARLGGASRFIGMLAEDPFGQLLARTLRDNQVDIRYIQTTKRGPTTLALVSLQADGQREFTFYHTGAADTLLEANYLNWDAWQDAVICHASSVALPIEPARTAILTALAHTRQRGTIVSFDANIRLTLWESQAALKETLGSIVDITDVLKFSVEEAAFINTTSTALAEHPDEEQLIALGKAILKQGPRLVIITLGARGALLFTAKHSVKAIASPVRSIDTTGAGDAFMGAILHGLVQQGCRVPADLSQLSEENLQQLGSFANRVAGISCTRYGGIASLPYKEEVNS